MRDLVWRNSIQVNWSRRSIVCLVKMEVKEKRRRGLTHIPTLVGIVRRMEGEGGGQEKKNFGRDRLRVVFHDTLCDVLHARL